MLVMVNEIKKLKDSGFEGFIPIKDLHNKITEIPKTKGVYIVLKNSDFEALFLGSNPGGHFRGRNPTVSTQLLKKKWIENTSILYIGKAGSPRNRTTLQKRIKDFIKFGQGRPIGHWGGRLIWQLKKSTELSICWKSISNKDPRSIEKQLLRIFSERYNQLPFANLRN